MHTWFHDLRPAQWFGASDEVDAMLAVRFGRWLAALQTRPADEFLTDPLTALASVLLFDQVPRNVHRGSPQAFATDPLARAICHGALARGWDRVLAKGSLGNGPAGKAQRQFLYMPLMHSEAIADQRLALALYAPLGRGHGWPFARDHHRMIARFGRFPHRNAVLGRRSTAAERRAVERGFAW